MCCNSRRLQASRALCAVPLPGMRTTQQPQRHPCAVSLPKSLGSAAAQAAHSCRSAHQISLLLPAEGKHRPQPNSCPLRTEPLGGLWAIGLRPWIISAFLPSHLHSQPFSLLASPICSHVTTCGCFNGRISLIPQVRLWVAFVE